MDKYDIGKEFELEVTLDGEKVLRKLKLYCIEQIDLSIPIDSDFISFDSEKVVYSCEEGEKDVNETWYKYDSTGKCILEKYEENEDWRELRDFEHIGDTSAFYFAKGDKIFKKPVWFGLNTSYEYDSSNNVIHVFNPNPLFEEWLEYHPNGNIKELHTDFKKFQTEYWHEYDLNGNLIYQSLKVNGDIYEVRFEYDSNGNCIRRTDGDEITTYEHDSEGNILNSRSNSGEEIFNVYEKNENILTRYYFK